MSWIVESDGDLIPLDDDLGELLNLCAIYNKEFAEVLANEIDREIIEGLEEE